MKLSAMPSKLFPLCIKKYDTILSYEEVAGGHVDAWFCAVEIISYGQASIHGRLHDTAFRKDCDLSVVALLHPESTLIQFTESNDDGGFILKKIKPGICWLVVTHPSHKLYIAWVNI